MKLTPFIVFALAVTATNTLAQEAQRPQTSGTSAAFSNPDTSTAAAPRAKKTAQSRHQLRSPQDLPQSPLIGPPRRGSRADTNG
jgi:hypothetical protein